MKTYTVRFVEESGPAELTFINGLIGELRSAYPSHPSSAKNPGLKTQVIIVPSPAQDVVEDRLSESELVESYAEEI